jgi:hypothetical protein
MKPTIFKITIAKLTLLILVVLMYGCNNSLKEINSETPLTKQSEVSVENTHPHSKNDSIELNNGAKWKVVPEMMKHIRNMESEIVVFSEGKHTELKDLIQLGVSLQKNIDLLTSNCTMEGKAHDELHKWLLPYIDMVDKLNKSKNSNEALSTFEEIKASYKTFNLYFE